ncbi:glycosyltransferase family 2 protein [Arenimonas sp.]|uniref:glycosyltransferase family 2 protein n=1 Tax=Arenimonas sp. TaxID=1872635 RepID=UPI0039E3DA70
MSVVVPLFNAASTIVAALDSIKATNWPSLEVIVVDDGSKDNGVETVLEYARANEGPRVTLLRHADGGNHGPAAARNLGIESASGEFVSFLDADDLYLPNRFNAAMEMLAAEPELDAVYGVYRYGFPGGYETCRDVTAEHLKSSAFDDADLTQPQLALLLSGKSGVHTSTITMRRQAARALGGFPKLKYVDDLAFWMRLFATGQVRRVDTEPVSIYVVHPDSWCSRGQASDDFLFGPAIACLNALEWTGARAMPDALRRMIEQSLVSKLLSRYHSVVLRGRASQKALLSLMLRTLKLAPRLLIRKAYLAVLARLVLNIHPDIPRPSESSTSEFPAQGKTNEP